MEETNETKNRDEKLSKPLKPEDVPEMAEFPVVDMYQKRIDDFRSSLEIEPRSGFFFYLKIPCIIFLGTLAGYVVGRFRLGISNIFIIAYGIFFVYNRKIERFTRSLTSIVYHSIRREKTRNNGESVEWMNYFFRKIWKVAEGPISSIVYQKVNTELLKVSPPFLNGLKLTEFTLGSQPPFIEGITYLINEGDVITMECKFGFIPLEVTKDAVSYLLGPDSHWNSKIQLSARLGTKHGIGVNLPILVKELYFTGNVRIIITLHSEMPFIKSLEVCFMEAPKIDFRLVPLKTVDIMDVPGLSKWIRSIMNTTVTNVLVNPNSITVDVSGVAKTIGECVGVVCLQILTLENEEDERLSCEVDIDGRMMYQSSYFEGRNIVYNEHFYLMVDNVDESVGVSFRSESKNSRRRSGNVFLKSLVNSESERKRKLFNKVRLVKNEVTHSFLNTSLQFFPILKKGKSNSAIVNLNLIRIEKLLKNGDDKNETYSTYCTVAVSPINRESSDFPVGFIENTVAATAFIVGGVIDTAGNAISSVVPGMESTVTKLLPPSHGTFYVFESKRIFASNSPIYNDKFTFYSRDLSIDVISICVMNDKNNEILGRVSVPLRDIHNKKKEMYKLYDAHSGRVELEFDITYIDVDYRPVEFVEYEKISKIMIESVNEKGVYYIVFETESDIFSMDSFSSSQPLRRSAYVPLTNNDNKIKFKLYKETINGDIFIGEDEIEQSANGDLDKQAFLINEQIAMTLSIQNEKLKNYTGDPGDKNTIKVIQVKLGKFKNNKSEVFVEFISKNEILNASKFTKDSVLNDCFTFISGVEDIEIHVKSDVQGSNTLLGKCIVPKRMASETIILNESGLAVDIDVNIQTCSYKPNSLLKEGYLEVYVKGVKGLLMPKNSSLTCKVLINEIKVYKTKEISGNDLPVFNESFIVKINKIKDTLGIQINGTTSDELTPIKCYSEVSLHNLNEGFSEMEFELYDSKTFRPIDARIRVGFNFVADHSALKIQKKSILSDIFGF